MWSAQCPQQIDKAARAPREPSPPLHHSEKLGLLLLDIATRTTSDIYYGAVPPSYNEALLDAPPDYTSSDSLAHADRSLQPVPSRIVELGLKAERAWMCRSPSPVAQTNMSFLDFDDFDVTSTFQTAKGNNKKKKAPAASWEDDGEAANNDGGAADGGAGGTGDGGDAGGEGGGAGGDGGGGGGDDGGGDDWGEWGAKKVKKKGKKKQQEEDDAKKKEEEEKIEAEKNKEGGDLSWADEVTNAVEDDDWGAFTTTTKKKDKKKKDKVWQEDQAVFHL